MSGVLRLGNTGAGTGRSTLEASASNDQTFTLPSAGGTLLTSNTSIPGGTITLDGATINITNGDLNVDSGTLFVDESTGQVAIGTLSPQPNFKFHVETTGEKPAQFEYVSADTTIADQLPAGIRIWNSSETTDRLSGLYFAGSRGSAGAAIYQVETAVGTNSTDCTADLSFWTKTTGTSLMNERMRLDSLGRLLIGRTSSSGLSSNAFLNVETTTSTACRVNIINTNSSTPESTQFGSQNNDFFFNTSEVEQLRLNSVGDLGLGTGSNITSQSGRCFHINGITGGQARIHLTTSASGSGAAEGSYIVALGAESGALAGSMGFENRENRDIFFSVGTSLTERFRIRQATNAGLREFAGIQTSGALKVSNAQYVTRSAANGIGAGIFPSAFGAYSVTGFIHAVKAGTTNFCIVACYKSGTSTGVDTTVIANSGGLAPSASNSGGTVTFNDTSSDVKMISIVYLTAWSD